MVGKDGIAQQTLSDWEQGVNNTEIGIIYTPTRPQDKDISILRAKNTYIFAFPPRNGALWLSQTAISKELRVPRRTITRWLSDNGNSSIVAKAATVASFSQSGLAKVNHPRYLVVCQSVEKFHPLVDG